MSDRDDDPGTQTIPVQLLLVRRDVKDLSKDMAALESRLQKTMMVGVSLLISTTTSTVLLVLNKIVS